MSTMKEQHSAKASINSLGDGTKKLIQVKLQKASNVGFGFNLVGGTDKQHLAGHSDIFVSRIRPGTPAAIDNRLEVGDIIVSVNGVDLSAVTHNEALALFRSASDFCHILVEKSGEKRILSNLLVFPGGHPESAEVKRMASNHLVDKSQSSVVDKLNNVTLRDATFFLSDNEKSFSLPDSPGSAEFSTRHRLPYNNDGWVNSQGSLASSSRLGCVKQNKNIQKIFFSLDDQEEIASAMLPSQVSDEETSVKLNFDGQFECEKEISETARFSDEQSSATSSISSNTVNLPRSAIKKKSPLDFFNGASFTNEVFFVSMGFAAVCATAFLLFRWRKKN